MASPFEALAPVPPLRDPAREMVCSTAESVVGELGTVQKFFRGGRGG
ncbi:MAG: hypothetical protein ABSE62_15220 [Chthoniobacteraceae bacterium]